MLRQAPVPADLQDWLDLARELLRFAGHPLRALRGVPRPEVDAHRPLTVGASLHQRSS